jgi:hypothetical protein
MDNQRLVSLVIGAASGSIATLLGVVLNLAFSTVAMTDTFAAALVAGIFTLIAVVITGALGTICASHLMKTSADSTADIVDTLNQ